jgi:hypothetical protein
MSVAQGAEIIGMAYDGDSNKGAPGVAVTLSASDKKNSAPRQQFTQSDGSYLFKDLQPGRYRLDFKKVGYTVIVPYEEVNLNSDMTEKIRVYPRNTAFDIQRIAAFLQERSQGNDLRLAASITTLHTVGVFDSRNIETIKLTVNQLEKTTGTIAAVEPNSNALILKEFSSSPPETFYYNKSTKLVKSTGHPLSVDQLRHGGSSKTATVLYKKDPEGHSYADKIIVDDVATNTKKAAYSR